MLSTLIDRYCRMLNVAMVACMAVMVVLVFGNVFMRYAMNSGISLSDELSRWLFVWMTFMGAVVALREHGHLGTDFLVGRLGVTGKKACLGLAHLLMLFCCWLLFKGSLEQVKINMDTASAVMEVPVAIFYASGMMFAVSAALILVLEFWNLLTGRIADDRLVAIQESEETGLEGSNAAHLKDTK